jgi:hypothetical protein
MGLVTLNAVVVRTTEGEGRTARVHVTLRPDPKRKAHWNNEAGPVTLWVDATEDFVVDRVQQEIAPSGGAVSHETRTFEFEVQRGKAASSTGTSALRGYVLYYACEDVDGFCVYLRQPFEIERNRLAAR